VLQGVHQGHIGMLTAQLKQRFGTKLPDWVPEKLESASERQLIAWGKRV
jgi:hypothetical protein